MKTFLEESFTLWLTRFKESPRELGTDMLTTMYGKQGNKTVLRFLAWK